MIMAECYRHGCSPTGSWTLAQESVIDLVVGKVCLCLGQRNQPGEHDGRVDLDNPVEVAHVDTEFEGAGRDDDTVPGLRECLFGTQPLGHGQRRMRQKCGDAVTAEQCPEFFDSLAGLTEHEPLLTAVQSGDDLCRVL